MANRWGNRGWLYFFWFQNHCRWWLQAWNLKMLIRWKESYDQPGQHIKKQRHYFANKGLSSKSYGFSSSHVWMWELDYKESWALKNCCFWTVVLGKLLRVPWTARRSNQSILKEISPGCSLKRQTLKLKLQYFGHLMRRADSFEKTLMLVKIEGRRRRGRDRGWDGWMASLTQWTRVWVNSGSWWWTGRAGVLRFMGSESRTRLSDFSELNWTEANLSSGAGSSRKPSLTSPYPTPPHST